MIASRTAARVPVVALAALALLAFVTFATLTALRPSASLGSTSGIAAPTVTLAQRNLPGGSTISCASGTAYVTGDMVGDASPADIYAKLCP